MAVSCHAPAVSMANGQKMWVLLLDETETVQTICRTKRKHSRQDQIVGFGIMDGKDEVETHALPQDFLQWLAN